MGEVGDREWEGNNGGKKEEISESGEKWGREKASEDRIRDGENHVWGYEHYKGNNDR